MATVKTSNITKAAASTTLGILILIVGTLSGSVAAGEFSWKSLFASLAPALILSVTDLLKEVKKQIDAPDEPATPSV